MRFRLDKLRVHLRERDERIDVIWRGETIHPSPWRFLEAVFAKILGCHQKIHKPIVFDFGQLTLINSAALASVLKFFQEVTSQNIDFTVYYDAQVTWQRVHAETFEAFRELSDSFRIENKSL